MKLNLLSSNRFSKGKYSLNRCFVSNILSRLSSLLIIIMFAQMYVSAETSTLTFTSACNGSGTADDNASWTVTSDASESNYDNTKGIHYGTGNVAVSYLTLTTSDISGTITEVVVNASGASGTSATLAVSVGGTEFKNSSNATTSSITATATSYTFTGSATGTIIVRISQSSATKAIYCKSIKVTYTSDGSGGEGGGGTPSTDECGIFHETWEECEGSGGNDNEWSGTIAQSTLNADNTGWTVSNGNGADGCAKFGSSKSSGSATTPSISVTNGNSYQLSFKAAPWGSEEAKLTITISGGTIENATSITTDNMSTEQWNNYQYEIVATESAMTIQFKASKNRFFLDEVCISEASSCDAPSNPLALTATSTEIKTNGNSTISVVAGTGNGEAVTYQITSANAANAEITAEGVFTATTAGTYTVQATQPKKESGDECTKGGTATITITVEAADITMNIYESGTLNNTKSVTGTPPLTLPSGEDACEEWTFAGWATSTVSKTTDKPTMQNAGATINTSGDYYAVYTMTEGGSESGTITKTMAEYAQEHNCTISSGNNATMYKTLYLNDDIEMSTTGQDNCGSFWGTTTTEWRLYQSQNGNVTLTSTAGDIESVKLTYTSGSNGILLDSNSNQVTNNTEYSVNASTVTFTVGNTGNAQNGQVKITAVEIKYGGGGTTYYSTTATCGPKVTAEKQKYYITSTKDEAVRINIPVSATRFENTDSKFKATSSDSKITIIGFENGGNIDNSSANDVLIIEYKPNSYDSTDKIDISLTDTKSYSDAATKVEVYCRSLPQQFVIVASNGGQYYAMRSDMKTANTYQGFEVTPNQSLTEVESVPECALYSFKADADNNSLCNFISQNGTAMLWGTVGTADSNHNIKNDTELKEAEKNNRAWKLETENLTEYELKLPAETSKQLRHYASSQYFGMYKQGQATMYLMKAACAVKPADIAIEGITHNSAILKYKGSEVNHTLVVNDGTTTLTFSNITSPYNIEGLEAYTTYTYTLTPDGNNNCKVEGEFTTLKAPITITLHRHGMADETISDIPQSQQPYNLPNVADPCEDWIFDGWATTEIDPAANSYTKVTSAATSGDYYSVYKGTSEEESGGEYSIDLTQQGYANKATVTTVNIATGLTAVFDIAGNKNNNEPTYYDNGTAVRMYDYNTLTITSTIGNITKIEFTKKSGNFSFSTETGTISDGVWTGDENQIIITATAASRISTITVFIGEATNAEYTTSPSCVPCASSGVQFTYPSLEKTIVSKDFTNAVVFSNKNSSGTQTYTSSNQNVATVNEATGLVHIVGKGETTITLKLGRDDSDEDHPLCSETISYTLTVSDPTVEIVGVTGNDEIIVEHDFEGTTTASLEEAQTTIEGNTANDIFISKYYEAASNMKLFALYNGTEHNIDMNKLRVRSNSSESTWATAKGQLGYVELSTISKLGKEYPGYLLPPFTEIIFWSNNYGIANTNAWDYNERLRECISMTIGGKNYTIQQMEANAIPNWYCLGDYKTYNNPDEDGNKQFVFNGDDGLILERTDDGENWYAIDLFGAGTSEAPVTPKQDATNGYVYSTNSNGKLNDSPGGFYWDFGIKNTEGNDSIISSNRFYLMRNKDVKDGLTAVAQNTTYFATFGSEWHGKGVGGYNDDAGLCGSGELFSTVAQYDYSNYYTEYVEVAEDKWSFTPNDDGTATVQINEGLANYACKYLRIEVTDGSGTKAKIEYKVPIIVKEATDVTNSELFNQHTDAICQTCDVAILNGGVLTKSAVSTTDPDDRDWVRNVDVYPGGELYIPKNTEYTINTLTIRSEGDEVGKADVQGTLNRLNNTLIHSKRLNTEGINYRWYYFSLPYDCNVADVTFSNGEPAELNKDFYVDWFDGKLRSETQRGGNWKSISEHPTYPNVIKAGYGYTVAVEERQDGHKNVELHFPMANFTEIATELQVPVGNWGAGNDAVRPNHKGWNLIGNPFLTHYSAQEHLDVNGELRTGILVQNEETGHWTQKEGSIINYTVTPKDGGISGYSQDALTDYDFSPFLAYIIQVGGDEERNDLYVTLKNEQKQTRNIVRRREAEVEDLRTVWVEVDLTNAGGEKDKTTLLISNRYTEQYDMSNDLVKWRGDSYKYFTQPVLATTLGGQEYAFNALPDSTAADRVALTYYSRTSNKMQINLSNKYQWDALEEVVIFDKQEGIEHNLLTNGAYEFYTTAGEHSNRLYLSVKINREKMPVIATADVQNELKNVIVSSTNKQILLNNLPEGTDIYLYDMQGKLISHQAASTRFEKLTVPASGVYNVRLLNGSDSTTLRTIVK